MAREDVDMNDVTAPEGRHAAEHGGSMLGTRCKEGCYGCGRTTSTKFYWWRNSVLAAVVEKIDAARPKSEKICDGCLQRIIMPQEVRSFP